LAHDPAKMDDTVAGAQAVLHLAGVNRADDEALSVGNLLAARQLTETLDRVDARPAIVYANSIQSGDQSPFGEGKGAAAAHLLAWGEGAGAPVADVRLPNLFGEHGRPHYNSVVATFCYELANNGQPVIVDDRLVPLMHAQDAVDLMLELADRRAEGVFMPEGAPTTVSALLDKLGGFRDLYSTGDIPDIASPMDRALFNTYRSYCFPNHYPIHPQLRSDNRGNLFECVRSSGGHTQVFYSSTRPGITRGIHFHLRKFERFLVLDGTAEIALRRLFDHTIVRFSVSGEQPAIVDMPTMWTHSITNTGSKDLMTLFWADEIFDREHPDTYPEPV
jgi:UDP-2-acetamido-2,6-beta-L-arabino-hexul-4-ose reductase